MATPVEHKQGSSTQTGNTTYQFEHEAFASQQEAEKAAKDLTALFKKNLNLKENSNFVVKCHVDTDEDDASIILNVFESKPSGKLVQKGAVVITKESGAWNSCKSANSLCMQIEQIYNKTKNHPNTEPNLLATINKGLNEFSQITQAYERVILNLQKNQKIKQSEKDSKQNSNLEESNPSFTLLQKKYTHLQRKVLFYRDLLKEQETYVLQLCREKSKLANLIASLKEENNQLKSQTSQLRERNKTLEARNSTTISAVEFRISLDSLYNE